MTFQFPFTVDQVTRMLPHNVEPALWYDALSNNLPAFHVETIPRVAAFIAQCSHESAEFTVMHENLNYRASSLIATWPTRFNESNAAQYEKNPIKIANFVYAKRMGNGDEASGDGYKYRGRGPIQITGKRNYAACSQALFGDDRLVQTPDLVEMDKDVAIKSACWYWDTRDLNHPADENDIVTITKKINGGTTGISDRLAKYKNALSILQGN